MVDDEDYELLAKRKWYFGGRGYVVSAGKEENKKVLYRMHRLILNPPPGMVVDHINRDRLDNRRSNLRICTHQQNLWNQERKIGQKTSRYKGVWRRKDKWRACIVKDGKTLHLGTHSSPEEAAMAYNLSAIKMHGEFARLNNFTNKTSI